VLLFSLRAKLFAFPGSVINVRFTYLTLETSIYGLKKIKKNAKCLLWQCI